MSKPQDRTLLGKGLVSNTSIIEKGSKTILVTVPGTLVDVSKPLQTELSNQPGYNTGLAQRRLLSLNSV